MDRQERLRIGDTFQGREIRSVFHGPRVSVIAAWDAEADRFVVQYLTDHGLSHGEAGQSRYDVPAHKVDVVFVTFINLYAPGMGEKVE